jgi:integrase
MDCLPVGRAAKEPPGHTSFGAAIEPDQVPRSPSNLAWLKLDAEDKPVKVPRGAVPSFHSFRHNCASHSIAEGDGAEEISWQLGHKDATVTRKIYIHEVKSAERSARRRGKMEARFRAVM